MVVDSTQIASNTPDLSVVIVSFNCIEQLKACLTSVLRDFGGLKVEVIVVDNQSQDGTVETCRQEFKDVHLIEAGANLGFSEGCNLGIEKATGRFILFLNPDKYEHLA